MDEVDEQASGGWLHSWQAIKPLPLDAQAAGAAHAQVRALDHAVKALRIDDEPWRLRAVLKERAGR
ncbi:MAG: hypothetical protein EA356_06050 [Geminicoccaceae bacterium]|nr:MAG: hypothetical protein EA356_06050 [Geminicoccaceae bacterium]